MERRFRVVSDNGVLLNKNGKKVKNRKTIYIPIFQIALCLLLIYVGIYTLNNTKKPNITNKNEDLLNNTNTIVNYDGKYASSEDNMMATVNVLAHVENGVHTSSGVVFGISDKNQLVVLTAKHSIDYDNAYFTVTFIDGNNYMVNNVLSSNSQDYAFLTIDMNTILESTLNTIKMVQYDSDVEYKTNENIYVLGYHVEKGFINYSGKITSSNINNFFGKFDDSLYDLTTDFSVISGTSGGGIYNTDGLILGICSCGNDEITKFVPIYSIIKNYKKYFE